MTKYDCTEDVLEHRKKVKHWLYSWSVTLESRANLHDDSKLSDDEKSIFDEFIPKLRELKFGSDEYNQARAEMGDALKHHYEFNRHHPEHFPDGVNDMTLVDIVEMVADWMAVAEERGRSVDLDVLIGRFNLSPQLVSIIANTLREEDVWNAANGHPTDFCPEDMRKGYVDGFESV